MQSAAKSVSEPTVQDFCVAAKVGAQVSAVDLNAH